MGAGHIAAGPDTQLRPGRPSLLRRGPGHEPTAVKALAIGLPSASYQQVKWREGTNTGLSSRFTALRVRPAHRDDWRSEQLEEEWLLIEWPEGDAESLKYFFSTAPSDAANATILGQRYRLRVSEHNGPARADFELLDGERFVLNAV
jgi:SRSO17 transposase